MESDNPDQEGRRADGKPFKAGNTRDDGSYGVGKNRPPEHGRFASGDDRPRGRRAKGTKNLSTEWRDELAAKITVTEGGITRKITKQRALIKSTLDRGIKKGDRAAELAFRFAEGGERRDPGLQEDDFQIIARWFEGILGEDSDDADSVIAADEEVDDE